MMADRLTDEELRRELITLGERKVGPITRTTRPIYVKKLNHLRARQNTANRSAGNRSIGKKLLGFSSDESEPEEDAGGKGRHRGGKRATQRRQAPRQPAAPSPPVTSYVRPSLRRRSLLDRTGPSKPGTSSFAAQASFTDSFNHSYDNSDNLDLPEDSLPDLDHFESSDTDDGLGLNASDADSTGASSPDMASVSVNTSPRLDDSRYWGAGSTSSYSPNSFSRPGSRYNSVHHTPTTSVAHSRSANHTVSPKTRKSTESEEELRKYGFKTREDPSSYNISQYISMFVLVLAGLFFLVLGFIYIVNIRGSFTSANEDTPELIFKLCPKSLPSGQDEMTPPCCQESMAEKALNIAADLMDIASSRAGAVECDATAGHTHLTWDEAVKHLVDVGYTQTEINDVRSVLFSLFVNNGHLNIRLIDSSGRALGAEDKPWRDMGQVAGVLSLSPDMGLLCRLDRALRGVVQIFVILVIASFLFVVGMKILRYWWKKQEEEKRQVYGLVEQIIDVLKTHHEQSQRNHELGEYVAIPHVRDMLIAPQERSKRISLWNRAVKFLSANESRVRTEVQNIKGEEFTVWRWIQATSNGGKVWQGQAFGDGMDGSGLNMPPYSPTPCLKIRNMFDLTMEYGENWHVKIQDAILEKCGAPHGILHIAVDKSSSEGCVYVKCTGTEAAGRAYRSLHGWWFDGNLVTVKYLRLERYHERFPGAASCMRPLVPSNNKRLSLSQPYHKSIIEAS